MTRWKGGCWAAVSRLRSGPSKVGDGTNGAYCRGESSSDSLESVLAGMAARPTAG